MNIVLTYDPHWKYTPINNTPLWGSLDTVDLVANLLSETGISISLLKADSDFKTHLREIKAEQPGCLVFWLNEFMPTGSGRDIFTVEIIEKLGMMHTGPDSVALGIGLDKEETKNVFRRLGLPTPESYVVHPGDCSPITENDPWDGQAIIKPLLQGGSKGISEYSVVEADNYGLIKEGVERIHHKFGESALVEKYIGGKGENELSVPILVSFDGTIINLPIVDVDLSKIPAAQGKFLFLTHDIKLRGRYRKIPADLPPDTITRIHSDVARIVQAIGCRDLARVDIRANSRGFYYIEVNVNPDKRMINSSIIMSAYSLGLEYPEILAFIPYQAMLKYGLKPPRKMEELVRPVMALSKPSTVMEAISN